MDTLVTSGGINGVHHGNKHKFITTSTEVGDLWGNEKINTVSIVTRHNTHAQQVVDALESGKNVFVEKPLALTLEDLDLILKKVSVEGYSSLSEKEKDFLLRASETMKTRSGDKNKK